MSVKWGYGLVTRQFLHMCQMQEFDKQVPLMDEIDTKVTVINFFL
jgi:hypothetical protein